MNYDSFRLQLKDILAEMDEDIQEIDWIMAKLENHTIEPTDEISLVIISKEADLLMDNLLTLDRQCRRYQTHSGQPIPLDATPALDVAMSWSDDLNSSFQWAYGRVRRIRKCCEYFKAKMAKDFGYALRNQPNEQDSTTCLSHTTCAGWHFQAWTPTTHKLKKHT